MYVLKTPATKDETDAGCPCCEGNSTIQLPSLLFLQEEGAMGCACVSARKGDCSMKTAKEEKDGV